MKPYIHARNSARKYGGVPEDYLAIHDFLDSTKAHHADVRHRIILHNSFGCWLAEQIHGEIVQLASGKFVRTSYIVNSDGAKVQVRDVAEDHVREDLGRIPSLSDLLALVSLEKAAVAVGAFRSIFIKESRRGQETVHSE